MDVNIRVLLSMNKPGWHILKHIDLEHYFFIRNERVQDRWYVFQERD
jgi:hypothetical protein